MLLSQYRKNNILQQIKNQLDNTNYDGARLSSLDTAYIRELGINLHSIIANVLGKIDWRFMNSFKKCREERNNADYDLNLIFRYDESKIKVEEIENLVKMLKSRIDRN